jgi:hypothetical protein
MPDDHRRAAELLAQLRESVGRIKDEISDTTDVPNILRSADDEAQADDAVSVAVDENTNIFTMSSGDAWSDGSDWG